MNPDFEWVLWIDKDNYQLVEKYAPQFLARYDGLGSEVQFVHVHFRRVRTPSGQSQTIE